MSKEENRVGHLSIRRRRKTGHSANRPECRRKRTESDICRFALWSLFFPFCPCFSLSLGDDLCHRTFTRGYMIARRSSGAVEWKTLFRFRKAGVDAVTVTVSARPPRPRACLLSRVYEHVQQDPVHMPKVAGLARKAARRDDQLSRFWYLARTCSKKMRGRVIGTGFRPETSYRAPVILAIYSLCRAGSQAMLYPMKRRMGKLGD